MDHNHALDLRTATRGVLGVVVLWRDFGGCTVRCGKRSDHAALNLLPRVVAGI
jgi:hypothetical protein